MSAGRNIVGLDVVGEKLIVTIDLGSEAGIPAGARSKTIASTPQQPGHTVYVPNHPNMRIDVSVTAAATPPLSGTAEMWGVTALGVQDGKLLMTIDLTGEKPLKFGWKIVATATAVAVPDHPNWLLWLRVTKQPALPRLTDDEFRHVMQQYQRATRELILEPRTAPRAPDTRISGVPWWPMGLPRPACRHGHLMAFVAQIRLRDVPSLRTHDQTLLSFHYCDVCAHEGRTAFGSKYSSDGSYDVSLFDGVNERMPDRADAVAQSFLPACMVRFRDVIEIPALEDLWSIVTDREPPESTDGDDMDENVYRGLRHVRRSKLGGWPSWQQHAEWPSEAEGTTLNFVGQLDYVLGENAPWCAGGYAYLFVERNGGRLVRGDMVLQTT